ncbi:hypothetical protein MOE15_00530 [Bacillus atrophaeus]|uniref:hypothetical protein n=1 Tax=Bacillus atrophaeus TaxID=1452 RepID=UPI0022812F37|nr:hypothetical protein [Bacillus atrophaeus]MCY8807029.1 hypothetical protein [Bacillus atrophaeus]
MSFIDKITGRLKLKQEITRHKSKIITLEEENKILETNVKKLHNKTLKLEDLNNEHLNHLKNLNVEIKSANDLIEVYREQISILNAYKQHTGRSL